MGRTRTPGQRSGRAGGPDAVLDVTDLVVGFPRGRTSSVRVLDGIGFRVNHGERLAIVGESGSGKTMIGLSILQLLPPGARVLAGSVRLLGGEIVSRGEGEMAATRGNDVSMIFQDPLSSLNPVRRIGRVMVETIRRHQTVSRSDAYAMSLEMLHVVGLPDAAARMRSYPHELSGGMRQRVMIALSLLNRPSLLIADEPTTALDATIQKQILTLLAGDATQSSIILITHDLAVAAELCDTLMVLYAGRIMEYGRLADVLRRPRHPYTAGLLGARPRLGAPRGRLTPVPGTPMKPADRTDGCPFMPRCERASDDCLIQPPLKASDSQGQVACWNPLH